MGYTEKFVEYLKGVNATEKNMKRQVGKIFKFKKDDSDVTVKIFKEKEDDKVLQGKIYINDEVVFEMNAYTTKKEGAIESVTKAIVDALDFIFKKEEKAKEEKKDDKKEKDAKVIKAIADGMLAIQQQIDTIKTMYQDVAHEYEKLRDYVSTLK